VNEYRYAGGRSVPGPWTSGGGPFRRGRPGDDAPAGVAQTSAPS